ncbi:hypothetical protein [Ottowia sp.]|uniref:putative PDDEXK endonuclease n=1 Tax=Ottowia sp. TaxID=1898956 RepID=UPI002C8B4FE6|nr:hypothetical protein [Ottowia sp.]HRN76601.1 hypothetical protein [Ottowia sp.]HRQ03644.1 hypothetical protein [Ottowia sp.]
MAMMSRRKGKTGEREIANLLADLTGCDVRRRVRQHDGDSDLEGLTGWCVECKRHAKASRADIAAWWRQAVAQAEATGALPVLFFRVDRADWRAVWPLAVNLTEQRAAMWTGYEWTAEGSIEAWCAVYREVDARVALSAEKPATARIHPLPAIPACDPVTEGAHP